MLLWTRIEEKDKYFSPRKNVTSMLRQKKLYSVLIDHVFSFLSKNDLRFCLWWTDDFRDFNQMKRTIIEELKNQPKTCKISSEAVSVIRQAAESHLVRLFLKSNQIASKMKRVTVSRADFFTAHQQYKSDSQRKYSVRLTTQQTTTSSSLCSSKRKPQGSIDPSNFPTRKNVEIAPKSERRKRTKECKEKIEPNIVLQLRDLVAIPAREIKNYYSKKPQNSQKSQKKEKRKMKKQKVNSII